MKLAMRLPQIQAEPGFPSISLFVLDGLANLIDLAFHIWMGRVLIPSDFAVLQTLNSLALVYVTTSGVFQPVVGRFVAEARGNSRSDSIPGIFTVFLRAALWLGILLATLVVLLSDTIAPFLNLPAWSIRIGATLILLGALRPIAVGVLQGTENFIALGLTRLSLSVGRILLVLLLMGAGFGLVEAVVALPFGWLVSVLCAFLLLGRRIWERKAFAQKGLLQEGWKLSFYALLAYLAYMSLTSLDLVWVNRNLSAELAGAYASLVLMRRIVALLPAVAVTVMFPRVVRTLTEGHSPARLLAQTAVIILLAGGTLATLFFVFGDPLITLVFGAEYQSASSLLGWMGIAMTGVSLSSIWLHYFLAEKPGGFVMLLVLAAVLEWILLNLFSHSLQGAVLAFGLTGWLLSLAGVLLYLFKTGRLPRHEPSHPLSP